MTNRSGPAPQPAGRRVGGKSIGAAALAMIVGVLAVEGGYVNHKADPGGETNMGITKRVAVQNGYTGPMRQLPREVAQSIYYRQYLVAPGYAPLIELDAAVAEELFDTAVNMGAQRPSRWLQQSINGLCGTRIPVDGRVATGTVAAFASCQARLGAMRLCVAMLSSLDARQRDEYGRLVRVNPRLRVFYRGWIAHRVGNVDRRKCSGAGR
ncbi:MAG: secretion activating protein [Alphaproteobacteria bacterium]|nr:MAG: secretion activating protein [Alphaproteobacteria bacterium]